MLLTVAHLDVHGFDFVSTGEDTSTGNTTEDVGTSTLHQGHESFRFQDLDTAVKGGFVVDTSSGGHHHATTDGINWVGSKTRDNSDSPAQSKGSEEGTTLTDENGLEGIVDTEVKTTVDEDTDAGDDETTVETTDTIRGNGLSVDIDETVVLTAAVFALGVVGQSGTGVVKRVDNSQGKGTSETTGGDVGGNFLNVSGVLWNGEH